jgi:hypothetical protein
MPSLRSAVCSIEMKPADHGVEGGSAVSDNIHSTISRNPLQRGVSNG